jgi:signal peptidase II
MFNPLTPRNRGLTKNLVSFLTKKNLLILSLIFFILDQLIKNLLKANWLDLNYLCNPGIAFGLAVNKNWLLFLNILVILFFVILILNQKLQKKFNLNPKAVYFFYLILAGALSNLIDRIRFGCVIDYINLKFWPVFNLADLIISLAFLGILLLEIKFKKRK